MSLGLFVYRLAPATAFGEFFSFCCNRLFIPTPLIALLSFCGTHAVIITFIFCHNCMGKISSLIPSACHVAIGGAECRKPPCVCLSAGRIKELIHLWKTNRLFRYDLSIILAQDMNSSVISIARGGGREVHSGTGGAERHVLHMVNCLAAGILRSAPPPPHPPRTGPPVSSPGSNLQTQPSPAGSSPGC